MLSACIMWFNLNLVKGISYHIPLYSFFMSGVWHVVPYIKIHCIGVIWQYFHISQSLQCTRFFILFNPSLLCFWHFVKRFSTLPLSWQQKRLIIQTFDNMNLMSTFTINPLLYSAFFRRIAHMFRFVFFIFVGFYIKFVRYNIAYIHR